MRPRTALLCLLAATAGCTAPANTAPSATEQTDSDTLDFSCTSYKPIAGLDLSVSQGIDAHLTVTAVESGTTVVERTLAGGERVIYHGSAGTFQSHTDYRVVIRASGSVRWNQIISRTEKVRLTVEQNGSVTVKATIVEDTPTPCPD